MCAENENSETTRKEAPQSGGGIGKKGLASWLKEISRETSAIMNAGRTSKELMDELYDDETGLPR